MTPLERRWVESEWNEGFLGTASRETDPGCGAVAYMYMPGMCRAYIVGNRDDGAIYGPDCVTLREAKSDAEAMYRQWVYDEYGVVLP
jgi:hypothetical protein